MSQQFMRRRAEMLQSAGKKSSDLSKEELPFWTSVDGASGKVVGARDGELFVGISYFQNGEERLGKKRLLVYKSEIRYLLDALGEVLEPFIMEILNLDVGMKIPLEEVKSGARHCNFLTLNYLTTDDRTGDCVLLLQLRRHYQKGPRWLPTESGMAMNGKQFGVFLSSLQPAVEQVYSSATKRELAEKRAHIEKIKKLLRKQEELYEEMEAMKNGERRGRKDGGGGDDDDDRAFRTPKRAREGSEDSDVTRTAKKKPSKLSFEDDDDDDVVDIPCSQMLE